MHPWETAEDGASTNKSSFLLLLFLPADGRSIPRIMATTNSLPAKIRYMRPELKGTTPRINSKETRMAATVEYTLPVTDARPLMAAGEFSLDTNGFVLARHESKCPTFREKESIKKIYYPEVCELVTRLSGAKQAVVQSHLVR